VLFLVLSFFNVCCWVLQEWVAKLESIPVEEVCLYCSGSPLSDDDLVASLKSFSIDVNVSLRGGKVHGSLARAGKVKGQTPKVRENNKPQDRKQMLVMS
jgi:small subunit ribosomal protein S30e